MDVKERRRFAVRKAGLWFLVLMLCVAYLVYFIPCIQIYGGMEQMARTQNPNNNLLEEDILGGDFQEGFLPQETIEHVEAVVAKTKEAKKASGSYIKILKKNNGQALEAYLENDYMDFSISLVIEGSSAKQYHKTDIKRINRKKTYSGSFGKGQDLVKNASITSQQQGQKTVCIKMQLKDIYEPTLYDTPKAYYISLKKPEKIYDHIVVVDAGHGGKDGGATFHSGKYCEKDYNLSIEGYLKQLLDGDSDIKVYYTRLSDKTVSKAKRVRLANAVHADAFVSIHCNASQPGDTSANGVEALYSSRKKAASDSLTSKELARRVMKQLCGVTGRKARRIIKRDGLYLMHHSTVPVTIIEVGYMSNQSDLQYLVKEENQQEIARGIYQGIIKSIQ